MGTGRPGYGTDGKPGYGSDGKPGYGPDGKPGYGLDGMAGVRDGTGQLRTRGSTTAEG